MMVLLANQLLLCPCALKVNARLSYIWLMYAEKSLIIYECLNYVAEL